MFFGGSIENSKNSISELYQNLTIETLSRVGEIQFAWISDLVSHITYKLQHFSLSNAEKKESGTKKYNYSIKEKYDFDEKPSAHNKFEDQIVMNILDDVPYDL